MLKKLRSAAVSVPICVSLAWVSYTAFILGQPATQSEPPAAVVSRKVVTDMAKMLNGTWKLSKRIRPDGTPYGSKIEGVTYMNLTQHETTLLGPRAVGAIYAHESGVLDGKYFPYPADAVGKPFELESDGSWVMYTSKATAGSDAEILVRTHSLARANYAPLTVGVSVARDMRLKLGQGKPLTEKAGGPAAVARLDMLQFKRPPGDVITLGGEAVVPTALRAACCGISNFSITGQEMQIKYDTGAQDVWLRGSASVPANFR
jgi:hypothetical protein